MHYAFLTRAKTEAVTWRHMGRKTNNEFTVCFDLRALFGMQSVVKFSLGKKKSVPNLAGKYLKENDM